MEGAPLLTNQYLSATQVYEVIKPDIQSGSTYYFTTGSGLRYQVTFGKKKNNYLGNIVNFGVLSDEFEDEYSETNRGEVYRIIATMIEIVRIYHENHPYSNSYEFSGEFKKDNDPPPVSKRTKLYLKTAQKVVDTSNWDIALDGNKVLITRKGKHE
jgi:hypothetical protein